MKKLYIVAIALFTVVSCDKKADSSAEVSKPAATEVSQVQEPFKIKNEKGEEVQVTYFAEGDQVAVKILKTGETEQKLAAKTTSASGNPLFTNENYMWEMTQEGKGGKLTSKSGAVSEYK